MGFETVTEESNETPCSQVADQLDNDATSDEQQLPLPDFIKRAFLSPYTLKSFIEKAFDFMENHIYHEFMPPYIPQLFKLCASTDDSLVMITTFLMLWASEEFIRNAFRKEYPEEEEFFDLFTKALKSKSLELRSHPYDVNNSEDYAERYVQFFSNCWMKRDWFDLRKESDPNCQ